MKTFAVRSLLAPGSRRLPPRVIPTLGANHQFAVPFGPGLDANLPEAAVPPGIGRLKPNRVLTPDIVRDGSADGVHFIQRLRKKCDPARALRHNLQRTLGALGMFFISQNANRIHRRPVLFRNCFTACSKVSLLALSSPSVTI